MGEDGVQAERSGAQALPSSEEHSPSPSPQPGEALRDSSQVNAITVLTLLDKLVDMLDAVQEKQHKMEQRQIELEGSVKGIQSDLSKLCKHHASTSNTVSKLLEKSRKVSAHTREVRERMERQCAQVKRLESNHAQLLRRNHFKVLIFQDVERKGIHYGCYAFIAVYGELVKLLERSHNAVFNSLRSLLGKSNLSILKK